MFGLEETNSSVFQLLATAARDLMNVSMQIKSSRPSVIANKRTIYCRILWSMLINKTNVYFNINFRIVSVHLKCLNEKGLVTRNDLGIWDKGLIQKVFIYLVNIIMRLNHATIIL